MVRILLFVATQNSMGHARFLGGVLQRSLCLSTESVKDYCPGVRPCTPHYPCFQAGLLSAVLLALCPPALLKHKADLLSPANREDIAQRLVSTFQAALLPHLCKVEERLHHLVRVQLPSLPPLPGPTRTFPGRHVTSVRLFQQQSLITCLYRTVPVADKHRSKLFGPNTSLDHKDQKVKQRFCSGIGYQQVILHSTPNSFSEHVRPSLGKSRGVGVPWWHSPHDCFLPRR